MSRFLVLALSLTLTISSAAGASDWPHLRGPAYDGRGPAPAEPGLELAWRVRLGSGYSGIAASGERVVTLFSQGDSDWVGAFDLNDGSELWRARLDGVYRGHDGSADGPVSSPVISGDRVFALGPKGQLVALDLGDGELVWRRDMEADFGAQEPDYGFGVTPLVAGGRLIVLTGVSGGAVAALDPATGQTIWSTGDGGYEYQIPIAVDVGGQTLILAAGGRQLIGLDPASGEQVLRHELAEGEGFGSSLTAVGEGRLLTMIRGDGAMFQLERGADGYSARELFRTSDLGRTYALPVHHEGYLYGFRGQILNCVDAQTGERTWRSRPPGGRGLILLGDHLAVFGADGHVVLVEANPERYVEVARVRALDASGYTWPSYAGGRLLVRNLDELAAVEVGGSRSGGGTEVAAAGGAFGQFLAELEATEEPEALIEQLFEEHPTMPVIEGGRAHFVWVGQAEDLAITGSMVPSGGQAQMRRVAGTDLYHRSFDVEPGGRWEYQYIRDFSERLADPRNPHTAPARSGDAPVSEFWLPGYERPDHLAERGHGERGELGRWTFKSKVLGGLERQVTVYLPPGYLDTDEKYPLLIVHQGGAWLDRGLLDHAVDNLAGTRARPTVVAFLEPRDEWWLEAGGSGTDAHLRMLVEELLPQLERRYRLEDDPASRALLGNEGYGLAALYAALARPDLFGKVAMQSLQTSHGYEDATLELIAKEPKADLTIYLDWSRWDVRNLDAGIDLGEESEEMARALRAGGYEFTGGEVLDSAGWSGWRSRSDEILETLFPVR